ncbi:MAG: hypothetical protein JW881_01530 [Spirochaetales bacterium]|nr:hypothetical protein [Spirochaetales bacterium]
MNKLNFTAKIECMVFILLVCCMGHVVAQSCGDVNSSGSIDIVDALMIAQHYVGLNPSNFNSAYADANGNGSIDIVDALVVAQYYVGLVTSITGCNQTTNPPTTTNPPATNPPATNPPTTTSAPGSLDCSTAIFWTATAAYENEGTRVFYNGNLYENNWYSTNENPEQHSGANQVWTLVGACDPALTPSPTPSPPPPVSWQGTSGYASRFWDCCKPHCAWAANVPAGMDPLKTCQIDGYTENPDPEAVSSCEGGDSYVCYKFIPWAIDDGLSYGFAATSSGDVCGKCFEMQFTGDGKYDPTPGAVALEGKRMIVMAINIGYDVSGGQFDILVPGGGVGAFNGCSTQWGISNDQLGAQYGGLLSACNQAVGYYDHEAIKNCLRDKNDQLFRAKGLTEMAQGLDWFIDWFEAADNPMLIFREVSCPQELVDISGMVRP